MNIRETRRRAAILSAAIGLLLSGGCRRDPRAPVKLAAGVDTGSFALDLPHNRVLYIRGKYPRKTYMSAEPLTGEGKTSSFRVPGYSLSGHVYPLHDGGVLLTAKTLGNSEEDGTTPSVLKIDVENEKVLADYSLNGAQIEAFAQPRWLPSPAAVVQNGSGLVVVPLAPGARLDRGVVLSAGEAPLVAIDEGFPVVAAAASDKMGRGALRLLDARTGRVQTETGVTAPGYLASRADGHWLASMEDEGNRETLVVDLDRKLGRAAPLFSTPGTVESIVAGKRWLFAVALSTEPHPRDDPRWLQPRELHRVDLTGAEPPLTLAWTKRKGSLLGLDESGNRLYFAVTDKDSPAVWSLDASSDSLRAAVAPIDGAWRLSWGLVYAITLTLLLMGFMIALISTLINGTP